MTPRWPQPDFLAEASSRRPAWVAWWAVGAALVLATTAVDAWSALGDVQSQRLRLARATQRAERGLQSRVAGSASDPTAPKSDVEPMRAAQGVMAGLRYPWGRIVADLEQQAPAGLQWLAVEHDRQTPQVRLEGNAPDIATALRVVDDLSARAGWSDVILSQLQPPDSRVGTASSAGWHFELRALVDPGRLATTSSRGS